MVIHMNKIVLKIEGMHCTGCSERLEKSLKAKKNIKKVKVNFEKREAEIEYDKLSKEDIESYIEDIGFHSLGE